METTLSNEEIRRYSRHLIMPEVGLKGQEKLKEASVLCIGAGGLGSPLAIYLTAAGIGTIRVADCDRVELSNLNRQVLYSDEDIGTPKAVTATEKLRKLNPEVEVAAITTTITEANVSELVADADLIVDAMDNLPTRYLLNKTAVEKDIPLFHGAVYGFEGRAMTVIPGKTACLNCVYRGAVLPKAKTPVIGVTPAVIGCIQATEVIKYLLGLGTLLTNRLLSYDGLAMQFREFKVKKDPDCQHCGHIKQGRL